MQDIALCDDSQSTVQHSSSGKRHWSGQASTYLIVFHRKPLGENTEASNVIYFLRFQLPKEQEHKHSSDLRAANVFTGVPRSARQLDVCSSKTSTDGGTCGKLRLPYIGGWDKQDHQLLHSSYSRGFWCVSETLPPWHRHCCTTNPLSLAAAAPLQHWTTD